MEEDIRTQCSTWSSSRSRRRAPGPGAGTGDTTRGGPSGEQTLAALTRVEFVLFRVHRGELRHQYNHSSQSCTKQEWAEVGNILTQGEF